MDVLGSSQNRLDIGQGRWCRPPAIRLARIGEFDLSGRIDDDPAAALGKPERSIDTLVDAPNELLAQTSPIAAPSRRP
jgi:hypothetical protein